VDAEENAEELLQKVQQPIAPSIVAGYTAGLAWDGSHGEEHTHVAGCGHASAHTCRRTNVTDAPNWLC
jgi:hypothetical protein